MNTESKIKIKTNVIKNLTAINGINAEKASLIYEAMLRDKAFVEPSTSKNRLESSKTTLDFYKKFNDLIDLLSQHGLDNPTLIEMVSKKPSILLQDPKTLQENVLGFCEKLSKEGLQPDEYIKKALKKQPSLMTRNPETLYSKVTDIEKKFKSRGLNASLFVKSFLKTPSLLTVSSENLINKITDGFAYFNKNGLSDRDYVAAGCKFGALFYTSPEKYDANISKVAEEYGRFGLSKKKYLEICVRQPSLFSSKPETIIDHIKVIKEICDKNVLSEKLNFIELIEKRPLILSWATDTLRDSKTYAHIVKINNNKPLTASQLFKTKKSIGSQIIGIYNQKQK